MINLLKHNALLIIVIGMLVYTGCNIAFDAFEVKGVWYIGNAFAFVCYSLALLAIKPHILTKVLFVLCLGQLSDELIGTPLDISLFEYIIPALYLIYLIYKNGKQFK